MRAVVAALLLPSCAALRVLVTGAGGFALETMLAMSAASWSKVKMGWLRVCAVKILPRRSSASFLSEVGILSMSLLSSVIGALPTMPLVREKARS